ncbi:MAG: hypothetical protein ACPF9D_04640, partial [Owenweeksia sp.]
VTGPDAANIYTIDGKRIPAEGAKPNFGSVQLITTRAAEPTAGKPLRFTVEVVSNTYRSESMEIEVEEEDYYVSRSLMLLNLNNLPAGINFQETTASLNANGELDQPLVFNTDATTGNTSQLEMTIPAGIKFMNENGAVLSGSNLKVEVLNFSDTTFAAQLALPNNTGALQKLEVNGQEYDVILHPTLNYEINMSIDGQEVRRFSGNGIELNMPLADHMFNYEANRDYQVGDKVSLISYSSGNTAWQDDGASTIVSEGGKLRVKPSVNHLTLFKLYDNISGVDLGKSSKIVFINNTSKAINQSLYFGYEIGRSNFACKYILDMQAGATQEFTWAITGDLKTVKFYYADRFPDHDITFSNEKIETTFKEPDNAVEVGYRLFCPSTTAVVIPPAGVKIYYRKTSEGGKFNHLYTFTGEDLSNKLRKVKQLTDGEFYDLKAYYGEYEVDTSNVQVENKKIYEITLPQALCSEIGF